MAKKGTKSAEIIFALRRFPEHKKLIYKAYVDKDVFNKRVKDKNKYFNTLSEKEASDLRIIIKDVLNLNIVLKKIDINLYEAACCNNNFVKKKRECIKKIGINITGVELNASLDLLKTSQELCSRSFKYGLTYSKICAILSKIKTAKKVVSEDLEILTILSTDPKKHFRYLYKGLEE